MTFATRKFDDVLPYLRADEVRSMARMWGGSSKLPKDECIALVRQGLNDPERVKAAVARLEPFEQVSLAMLKQSGGVLGHEALLLGVLMSGVQVPHRLLNAYDPQREFVRALIHRGIILGSNDLSPTSLNHYGTEYVYTDLRLLAAAKPVAPIPLTIKATAKPATVLERRPASVALALIGLLQTVADMKNGVGITQKGEIRTNEQRKIQRAMQWEGDTIQVDGLPFHDPTTLFLTALRYSAWAEETPQNTIELSETPAQIAERPYAEQIQGFLQGVLRATNWSELQDFASSYYLHRFAQARQILLTLLAAVPIAGDEFYAVDDLDQILFNRIGPYFSLTSVRSRPYTHSKSNAESRKIEEEWRTTLRANWLKQERRWLERALTTWVYFWGLVDLGFEDHKLVSIRLSQVGREVLHPALAPAASEEVVPTEGAWIVQPNFEILVYLDHVTPAQLAFLERHAERIQSQQHVAQYRLTRESVYQGLESGTRLEDLLQQLGAGMKADLPQNVTFEIKAWAAQREQLTLYRSTYLVEFQTHAERESALALGLQGQPIGERFILRSSSAAGQIVRVGVTKIDYSRPLPVAFTLGEDGHIALLAGYSDLLIEAQLDQWANRLGQDQWQLNAAQVQTNVKNGVPFSQLLDFLAQRAQSGLPDFLRLTLQAWAGNAPKLEVERVVVLHCPSAEVRQIIQESSSLHPYLEGRLSNELLVVKASKLKALQEHLQQCGMPPLTQLTLKKLRK